MENNQKHSLFGAILLGICCALATLLTISYTFSSGLPARVAVNNTSPIFENVYVSHQPFGGSNTFPQGVDLLAGQTQRVYINGAILDNNHAEDIVEIGLTFFRERVENGDNCSENGRNCYHAECELRNKDYRSKAYNCPLDLQFYTDATSVNSKFQDESWIVSLIAIDKNYESMKHNVRTVEINSLLAVEYTGDLLFDNISPGQATTERNNKEFIFTQKGNAAVEVYVHGQDLTCSGNKVLPYKNIEWSLYDISTGHEYSYQLTDSRRETGLLIPFFDENITHRPYLYWNIIVPGDVSGVCSGHVFINYNAF